MSLKTPPRLSLKAALLLLLLAAASPPTALLLLCTNDARSAVAALGSLLVTLAITWFFASDLFVTPLQTLVAIANDSGTGHAYTRRRTLWAPELRRIAYALDHMALQRNASRVKLAQSEETHRILTENIADIVVRLDSDFHRLYLSNAVRDILGYEPEYLVKHNELQLIHPDDVPFTIEAVRSMAEGTHRASYVARFIRKDGGVRWLEVKAALLDDGRGYVATLRDVTERRAAEDALLAANHQLETMASQDGLTGVANRRRFDELFEQEWRRAAQQGRPMGLLLIDVDHFKSYNDHYGHPAGDDVLRQIAAIITEALRRSGDTVARYGGEEFGVILPNADHVHALQVAERIRLAVRDAKIPHLGNNPGVVTVSVGIASARPPNADAGAPTLLQEADDALYVAKRLGRNRVSPEPARGVALTDHCPPPFE